LQAKPLQHLVLLSGETDHDARCYYYCYYVLHLPQQKETPTAAAAAAAAALAAAHTAEAAAQQPVAAVPSTLAAAGELLATTSLWEIAALRRHYHPAVSTLAKGFAQKASGAATNAARVEPFTALTYKALFDQEMKRKSKGTTAVTFVAPLGLFQGSASSSSVASNGDGVGSSSSVKADINVFAGNFDL
jgi:CBF/Mak21 family